MDQAETPEKYPETELEFWYLIEGLGGFIWSTQHALAHSRITDHDGKTMAAVMTAQERQEKNVNELCQRFNIIHPKDSPARQPGQKRPRAKRGKRYYWDWYEKMQKMAYELEYNNMICSACPFSKGVKLMISTGGQVPCGKINGFITRLRAPHLCGMRFTLQNKFRDSKSTDQEILYELVLARKGPEVLAKLKAKATELKATHEAAQRKQAKSAKPGPD